MQEERTRYGRWKSEFMCDYTQSHTYLCFSKILTVYEVHVMWALHISYPIVHCACSIIHFILSASEIYMYQLSRLESIKLLLLTINEQVQY